MNLIREQLGEEQITCADYSEIEEAAKNFTVDIKVVNAFFDAKKFSEDGIMEYAQTFTKTTIMPEFGQIK